MGKAIIFGLLAIGFVFLFSFVPIQPVSAYFSETGNVESSSYNFETWTLTEDLHRKHRSVTLTHKWSSPSYSASFEQEGWGVTSWQPVVLNNQPPRDSERALSMALNSFNLAQTKRFRSSYGSGYYGFFTPTYW